VHFLPGVILSREKQSNSPTPQQELIDVARQLQDLGKSQYHYCDWEETQATQYFATTTDNQMISRVSTNQKIRLQ